MKKINNIASDVRSNDSLETAKRLYKSISEISKHLEDQKNQATTVIDVFTPKGEILRTKLRDYCERLIIDDPINHIQKTEELLWRRGFYDIVNIAKKLRKGSTWNEKEKAYLSTHCSVGIGFYHHLILRLQLEYNLDLTGIIDFGYQFNQKQTSFLEKNIKLSKTKSEEAKKFALRFIHRSLICLGDLSRYKLDIDPYWDTGVITRYYKVAIVLDYKYGMPHNQLGTVAGNNNYGLDAVFHYMRSTICLEPFEGAEGNLRRVIALNLLSGQENSLVQCCIARLLLLIKLWENEKLNIDEINQESQVFLNDLENCLKMLKYESENIDIHSATNEDSIEKYLQHFKNKNNNILSDDIIFKIIMICIMTIIKIQSKESNEIHSTIAFILAIFSQLLQHIVIKLQEPVINITKKNLHETIIAKDIVETENNLFKMQDKENNENFSSNEKENINNNSKLKLNGNHINGNSKKIRDKSKSLLRKLRRPRKQRDSSDSDGSDGEYQNSGSISDEINSDISETEGDFMSETNNFSDDALSDDSSDDDKELSIENEEIKEDNEHKQVNGFSEKLIETQKDKIDLKSENENDVIEKLDVNATFVQENSKKSDSTNGEPNNTNTKQDCIDNKEIENSCITKSLNIVEVLNILKEEKILISIKILCDWLKTYPDMIQTCAKGSKTLLKHLVMLLNIIHFDFKNVITPKFSKNFEIFAKVENMKISETIPLPEEIDLRGIKIFENVHKNIDWNFLKNNKMNYLDETLLRSLRFIEFGHYLCSIKECGIVFDDQLQLFKISEVQEKELIKENEVNEKNLEVNQKGKLMRHMGKLWLKAEVTALENRLHCKLMSPYLIPDHEAFTKFMPLIKNLVYAKKFVVVIPSVVVSALDEMKRISIHAREATRWLESQLKRGSRFLRAQRPHEKLTIPYVKGPKPKDKEAWLYFQIIEFCHFLTQQSKAGDSEIPVVTLLTGIDGKVNFTFSPEGLAKSAGANFEHISTFHTKWKSSTKSHG